VTKSEAESGSRENEAWTSLIETHPNLMYADKLEVLVAKRFRVVL
jgi:hypothetical protein